MKYSFPLLLIAIILCFSKTFATTHIVTTKAGNSPWSPGVGSLAKAIVDSKNTGDTIIFDYSILGSPLTYPIPATFSNFDIGGFTLDGLRGLPSNTALTQIQLSTAPGNGGTVFRITQNSTTLIGIDFVGNGGNGLIMTSSNNIVDSCYIHDFDMHGINISNTASNAIIKNSHIYNNNKIVQSLPEHAAIYSVGANTTVDSCYIYMGMVVMVF